MAATLEGGRRMRFSLPLPPGATWSGAASVGAITDRDLGPPTSDTRPGGHTSSFRALAFSSPLSGWLLMADILITEEASGEAIEALKTRWRVQAAPGLLAAAERLEVIGRIGVGMDNIDGAAASARGIVVCYAAEENAVSVAEHVFALLLALARKIPAADRS